MYVLCEFRREQVVGDLFHRGKDLGERIKLIGVAVLDQLEALLVFDTGVVETDEERFLWFIGILQLYDLNVSGVGWR